MSWDAAEIKDAVGDRWPEVLASLGHVSRAVLDGRPHACPRCGGRDRFSVVDLRRGALLCRKCHHAKNGDWLSALMWLRRCTLPEAIAATVEHLGLEERNGKPERVYIGSRRRLAARGETEEPEQGVPFKWSWLKHLGAWKQDDGIIVLPAHNGQGEVTGTLAMLPSSPNEKDRKGMWDKGDDAGVYIPHVDNEPRLPRPGELWCLCEGPKDAACLAELQYNVLGLPGVRWKPDHPPMLAGCDVVLCMDLDTAGRDAEPRLTKDLAGIARSVKIARLPGEFREKGGIDAKDVLEQLGPAAVHRAIREAKAPEGGEREIESEGINYWLTADTTIRYLINGVMVAGEGGVMTGPRKTLKTSMLVDMGLSLSSGKPFLGQFEIDSRRPVGMISCESSRPTLASLIQRVAAARGMEAADFAQFQMSRRVCHFAETEDNARLRRWIERHKLGGGVLIAEPAYMLLTCGEQMYNYTVVAGQLTHLTTLLQDYDLTIVIATHAKKLSHYKPLEMDDIAFPGFAEWQRQWWLLNRRSKFDENGPDGRHELWMGVGGGAGHSGLWAVDIAEGRIEAGRRWDVDVRSSGDARADQKDIRELEREIATLTKQRKDADEVLAVLKDARLTLTEIREQMGWGSKRTQRAIDKLTDEDAVTWTKETRPRRKEPDRVYTRKDVK